MFCLRIFASLIILTIAFLGGIHPALPVDYYLYNTLTEASPSEKGLTIDLGELITVVPRDSIPAISNPQFEKGAAAERHMKANEPVIGLSIIEGKMKGSKLKAIPALQTTWSNWKKLHPNTLALSKEKSPFGIYDSDRYESYYDSPETGLLGPKNFDSRIDPKELILGLMAKGKARAYSFSMLKENPVINDELGGIKVLVVFDSASHTGAIFERTVLGKILTFRNERVKSNGLSVITDLETKTVWLPLVGRAIKGKLKGKSLKQLPSTYAFWFAWRDYFPFTGIFQPTSLKK